MAPSLRDILVAKEMGQSPDLGEIPEDEEDSVSFTSSSKDTLKTYEELEIDSSIDDITNFWISLHLEMTKTSVVNSTNNSKIPNAVQKLLDSLDTDGMTETVALEMFNEWLGINNPNEVSYLHLPKQLESIPLQPSQLTSIEELTIDSGSPLKDNQDFIAHFPNLKKITFTNWNINFQFLPETKGITIEYVANIPN